MSVKKTDVVVVGGGVLGVCIAYWVKLLFDCDVILLERESTIASVTTKRNTGVIHRPFYLDPQKKHVFAMSAQLSYNLWKTVASQFKLPWYQCGTLELAVRESDIDVIEKYRKWAAINGMDESETQILYREDLKRAVPLVSAFGGILSVTDTSTDFQILTEKVSEIIERLGVKIYRSCSVTGIENSKSGCRINYQSDAKTERIDCDFLINATGSSSLKLAHEMDLGLEYSNLYFRGEYWRVSESFGARITKNIYTVPQFREFPFLDPHLIVRHNGIREIGPNAVPVASSDTYSGYFTSRKDISSFVFGHPITPKLRLFSNHKFLSLVMGEWKSSLGRRYMVRRVQKFIPEIDEKEVLGPGISGVRSSVIDRDGFVPEAVILKNDISLHIINFNSPGATGAPSFAYHTVMEAAKKGYFDSFKRLENPQSIWMPNDAAIQ